jgi:DNA polymerase III delta subunit
MIYLFFGTDRERGRSKWRAVAAAFTRKHPEGQVFQFATDTFNLEQFQELIAGQDMFGNKRLVVGDSLGEYELAAEFLDKNAAEIIASPTVFALWEDALSAAQKKKLEKLGAKLEECTAPEVKPAVDFNLFTITDAWGDRAREKAWTLFATALFKGVAPEEVFWKLVWQTKNLLLLKKTANPAATGLKPFVIQKTSRQLKNFSVPELEQLSSSLVTLWHEARRGRVDFEVGLERLILSI